MYLIVIVFPTFQQVRLATVTIRIIHTSDIHLDAAFAGENMPPSFGNLRRQAIRDILHKLLTRALEWRAHAVLIAGDLLEDTRVTQDTLAFLCAEFDKIAPIPIYISPGNHDPYVAQSPYATLNWPGNVKIFTSPQWMSYEFPDVPVTVHGFAFDGTEVSQNPFSSFSLPIKDDRIHIVLAHGSEMGCLPPEKGAYAPFRVDQVAQERLKYVALGHYHSFKKIQAPNGTVFCYPGTPEGLSFKETGPRYYVEIEIDNDQVIVRPVRSSSTEYLLKQIDCTGFTTTQQIVDALRALRTEPTVSYIARIELTGACAESVRTEIRAVRDAVSNDFHYLDIIDALGSEEDYEAMARDNTSLGGFVRRMNEKIQIVSDPDLRRVFLRAREVGVAAFRGTPLPLRGTE